jgi:hypothetical protein
MRWRLLLEECGPEVVYIHGKANIVADALSRLPMKDSCPSENPIPEDAFAKTFGMDPKVDEEYFFPVEASIITTEQQKEIRKDKKLEKEIQKENSAFSVQTVEGHSLLWEHEKIYVPKSLRN